MLAGHKHGTAENFVACHQQGVVTHLGDAKAKRGKVEGIFSEERFAYQPVSDTCLCSAGRQLRRRLWRQQIQDCLIAAIQNIRILLAPTVLKPAASAALVLERAIWLNLGCWWATLARSGPAGVTHLAES